MATHLDVGLTWRGRTAVIALEGAVDLFTSHLLAECISNAAAEGATDIHIDLSALRFIDSSGLRVLVDARRTLAGTVWASGGTGLVLRVLEVAAAAPALNAEDRSLAWLFAPGGMLTN